jgi:hypothetical protein
MGFGGPVWHASVSGFGDCRAQALRALEGVGDESSGQWEEQGEKAYHVRRRLSVSEVKVAHGLSVCDIRSTPEYGLRRSAMQRFLPLQLADWQE